MEDKILVVKAERVLEAANTCNEARRALRLLFPEAFAETGYIPGTIFAHRMDDSKKLMLIVFNGMAYLVDMTTGKVKQPRYKRRWVINKIVIPDEHLKDYKVFSVPVSSAVAPEDEDEEEEAE